MEINKNSRAKGKMPIPKLPQFFYFKKTITPKAIPRRAPLKNSLPSIKIRPLLPKLAIITGLFIIISQFVYPSIYFASLSEDTASFPRKTFPTDREWPTDYALPEDALQKKLATKNVIPELFFLSIPKLNLNNLETKSEIDGSKKEIYLPVLEKGIAHYKGTPLPGDNGISVLFGHSSFPWLLKDQDKRAPFSKLTSLEEGDDIYVAINDTKLHFAVTKTKVIKPEDLSAVLKTQDQSTPTLMLLTCVPPGQKTFRLLVFAKLVE